MFQCDFCAEQVRREATGWSDKAVGRLGDVSGALLWLPSSLVTLLTINSLQMPLHSRPKRSWLVSQFQADFTILVGNCKYYQNVATLTCGSGAVAGSGMVGTDPFTRVSVETKPALYWPSLLKQSNEKWLARRYKLTGSVAGTLSLQMKHDHFCCSNQAICVSSSERWHCKTLLAYRWTHWTSPWGWTPPLRNLISSRTGGRPMKISPFVM